MATILITGGTGMIGSALAKELVIRNHHVIILTRNIPVDKTKTPGIHDERISYALWNINDQAIDADAISKADCIIHLAGENVGEKRWTKKRKQQIADSRVLSGRLLVKSLTEIPNKVHTVMSSSGIGWYNAVAENGKKIFRESDPAGSDFLGETCRMWEESIQPVSDLGKRLVKFRTGMVLAPGSLALKKFKMPLRFGFASILGSGRQVISWIHIEDLVRVYLFAMETPSMNGIYNAVAPFPVTNKTFVIELAKQVNGKFFFPMYVPSFLIKLLYGEMSIEVLKSANVSCKKLQSAGFDFLYPTLNLAMMELFSNKM